jgi:hypothetical protein
MRTKTSAARKYFSRCIWSFVAFIETGLELGFTYRVKQDFSIGLGGKTAGNSKRSNNKCNSGLRKDHFHIGASHI